MADAISGFQSRARENGPKGQKSEKNQGPIFMFFFTLRAIFSGLRSKSENRIGHVNCVVLSYRMIPQKTKFAYRSRL